MRVLYGGERTCDALKHPPSRRAKHRWSVLPAGALAALALVAAAACSSSPSTTSAPTTTPSATVSAPATHAPATATGAAPATAGAASATGLIPDPNGPAGRCLLGGTPVNIEFYGIDGNAMCPKYAPVMAAIGLGDLRVQLSTNGTEIPPGSTDGCLLAYPAPSATSFAWVSTYDNAGPEGAGPLARKVCARLTALGWAAGT